MVGDGSGLLALTPRLARGCFTERAYKTFNV
jgi:hypothetical protein